MDILNLKIREAVRVDLLSAEVWQHLMFSLKTCYGERAAAHLGISGDAQPPLTLYVASAYLFGSAAKPQTGSARWRRLEAPPCQRFDVITFHGILGLSLVPANLSQTLPEKLGAYSHLETETT